ncbi:MFS transporter [Salininema proteolyticum]|uniref:MFS transporter n=1 Tax=Salininema proteolyticum TaxID=1607685 RepID=A0ABV8TXK0_9ACTN
MKDVGKMSPVQRLALITIGIAQLFIAVDYSSVYVAMPSMGADLGMSEVSLQWIITAYGLPFAGFMLLGGRLVDRYGAVRTFVFGNVAFGAASVMAALATDGGLLLGSRVVQGLAAAVLSPAILALLSVNFPDGPNRSRAYSIWGAVGASGLAFGVLLGGGLTEISWRWIFIINIPLVLVCIAGVLKISDAEKHGDENSRVPILSTTLGTASVLLLVLALTFVGEGTSDAAPIAVTGAAAIIVTIAFLVNERRSRTPLVDRALRKISTLRRGALGAALYMSSVGTEFFIITLYLQDQRDYSPVAAGIAFLPLAAFVTLGNIFAGRLLKRLTVARTLGLGFAISAAGLLLLAFSLSIESYWIALLPGFVISGLGHGMVYTSMFVLGNTDVKPELSGSAGSLITASQYSSAAFGTAVLTIIIVAVQGSAGFAWGFGFNALVAVAGIALAATTRLRGAEVSEAEAKDSEAVPSMS